MAWGMVAGAAVSVVGNVAGGSMDAENGAQARQEDRELTEWQTKVDRQDQRWNAELGMNQWGAETENSMLRQQNSASVNMWGNKYGVENDQARFDAFQAEFGVIQDNVNNYFKTLSASSVKAQNNDSINARIQGVNQRLTQTMAERGIAPTSGVFIQAEMQNSMQGEMAKVEANRNVDTEVAGQQQQFMGAQANNPFLARAQDFEAGIMDTDERDSMVSKEGLKTSYDIPKQQALPTMPEVKAPEKTGLSGFISSIF